MTFTVTTILLAANAFDREGNLGAPRRWATLERPLYSVLQGPSGPQGPAQRRAGESLDLRLLRHPSGPCTTRCRHCMGRRYYPLPATRTQAYGIDAADAIPLLAAGTASWRTSGGRPG